MSVREVEDQLERGDLVDPAKGRTTVGEWWGEWMLSRAPSLRPSTVARDESYWRSMTEPSWGRVELRHVDHGDVTRWVLELSESGRAPRTVAKAYRLLTACMDAAVLSRVIATNRAKGVKLPRVDDDELEIISASELTLLVEVTDPAYRSMIEVMAWGALRIGEAAALRWDRVDVASGMLEVVATAGEVRGAVEVGRPKTKAGTRSVPLPRSLVDRLDGLMRSPSGQVWPSPDGKVIRVHNWRRRVFNPARGAADLDLTSIHRAADGVVGSASTRKAS